MRKLHLSLGAEKPLLRAPKPQPLSNTTPTIWTRVSLSPGPSGALRDGVRGSNLAWTVCSPIWGIGRVEGMAEKGGEHRGPTRRN